MGFILFWGGTLLLILEDMADGILSMIHRRCIARSYDGGVPHTSFISSDAILVSSIMGGRPLSPSSDLPSLDPFPKRVQRCQPCQYEV